MVMVTTQHNINHENSWRLAVVMVTTQCNINHEYSRILAVVMVTTQHNINHENSWRLAAVMVTTQCNFKHEYINFQNPFSTLAHEEGRKMRHLPSRDSSSGMLSLRSAASSCSRMSACADITGCIFINILAISSCSSLHTSTLIIHTSTLIIHPHTLIVHPHTLNVHQHTHTP